MCQRGKRSSGGLPPSTILGSDGPWRARSFGIFGVGGAVDPAAPARSRFRRIGPSFGRLSRARVALIEIAEALHLAPGVV